MRIVFYTGYHKTSWSPNLLDSTGLGGTEQCVLNLARQFATDHEVYVVGDVNEGYYDKVCYCTIETLVANLKHEIVDCVIGVSYINYLLELKDLNFKNSIFWVHNTDFFHWHRGEELPNRGRDLLSDRRMSLVVCLTNWHKNKFIKKYDEVSNKVIVIGNGVSTHRFLSSVNKKANSFIYSSHAERGLQTILDEWNSIKLNKPDATLNIATPLYGLQYFNDYFLKQVNEKKDVFFHGSLSLEKLYRLMSTSEYWYYPTEYEETFCITAIEMLGHKVTPIASKVAGLNETLSGFNLETLDNINNKIDFTEVSSYVRNNDWKIIKNKWKEQIKNMNGKNTESENNDILDIECVYIISLDTNEDLLNNWKSEIRNNLLPWYDGPIVCKRGVLGTDVTDEWLSNNGYSVYENWKIENHNNSYWSENITSGELGCAISHHRIWVSC